MQNADTAKQLTAKQQSQEEVARVKEQLAFQMEQVKRESELKVRRPCAQGLALECAPPGPPSRPTVALAPPHRGPGPTTPPGPAPLRLLAPSSQ